MGVYLVCAVRRRRDALRRFSEAKWDGGIVAYCGSVPQSPNERAAPMTRSSLRENGRWRLTLVGWVAICAAGCASGSPEDLSSTLPDAGGLSRDATPAEGLADAGPIEAGDGALEGGLDAETSETDPVDAALSDEGALPDVGEPDGGDLDGGEPDAGRPDSGHPDSGLPGMGPPDMELPDMQLPDAGGSPCVSDVECGGGLACVAAPGGPQCAFPPGPGRPGSACEGGDACRSGLCDGGRCARLCGARGDCGAGEVCVADEAALPGGGLLCRLPPVVACARAADCAEDGRVCGTLLNAPTPDLYCALPFDEGGASGAPCEGALLGNPQCETGMCLAGLTGECAEGCGEDDDCGEAQVCGVVGFNDGELTVGLCLSGCARPRDCRAEQVCALVNNVPADRRDLICQAPLGAAAVGAECESGRDCESGLCLTVGQGAYCTVPCVEAEDCPDGFGACDEVTSPRPTSGEPQAFRMCRQG